MKATLSPIVGTSGIQAETMLTPETETKTRVLSGGQLQEQTNGFN
jgi:hypothetical protein